MPESPNVDVPERGFWSTDSVVGLSMWAMLLVFYAVMLWPISVDHPGVREALGVPSYSYGNGRPEVMIEVDREGGRADPLSIRYDLPDGRPALAHAEISMDPCGPSPSMHIHLACGPDGDGTVVDRGRTRLVDSSGFAFPLTADPSPGASALSFATSDVAAIRRLRFNDPSYALSLTVSFDHGGERVIDVKTIRLHVGHPKGGADTPGHAVVPLLFSLVFFLLPAYLVGRAWGRRRRAVTAVRA